MGLFFVAHIYDAILALIFLMGTLTGHAWAEKARNPDEEYHCPVVVGFRAVYFILATGFAFIFYDTIFKELILGVFGYGNVMHYLGILIVLGVLATQIILGAVFVAPTRKGLITFFAMLAVFIYLWEFYFPNANIGIESAIEKGLIYLFATGFVVQISLSIGHFIYLRVKRDGKKDKRLWDIRRQYKKVFSLKLTIILWILVYGDLVLHFEGHGLLSWLSLDAFLGGIIGIVGGILVYLVLKARREQVKLKSDEWNQVHFCRTDKLIRKTETIKMDDGEILQAYIYRSTSSPGGKSATETLPGPAVLFLHGFGGFAQDIHFEPMLSSLALGGYTVFAYDYRWSGHSRKKGQKGVFQGLMKEGAALMENLFSDAKVAINWVISHEDLVDPKRLAIIGFSYGGTIALSDVVYANPLVKVIIAGCALHDLGENIREGFLKGNIINKVIAKFIFWQIKKNTKDSVEKFLEKVSRISPASMKDSIDGIREKAGILPDDNRLFLTHCKDDSVVNYEMNFLKNKAMFNLSDDNCLIFEKGDHVFEHNENPLGAWIFFQLRKNL
ncbi:MAG: alpha/beta hydrolase family protein [Promethearchaeota archaeon]